MLVPVSISQSDVELEAEPCLSLELVLRVIVVDRVPVLGVEPSCIARVLEEYRQLELSLHAHRPVDEVDQIEPLVDDAVPEQGSVKRVFVDDD